MALQRKNSQDIENEEDSAGLTRRDFFKLLAGSAVPLAALDKATAAIQSTNPYDVYNFLPTFQEETRAKLAAFIQASPEEVVFTHNTTEGLNFVTAGLDMKEGDEVIVSNMEHPGAINPWKLKEKRHGIVIKEVPFGLPTKSMHEVVSSMAAAGTPRTKLISLGHTVFITGLITPL